MRSIFFYRSVFGRHYCWFCFHMYMCMFVYVSLLRLCNIIRFGVWGQFMPHAWFQAWLDDHRNDRRENWKQNTTFRRRVGHEKKNLEKKRIKEKLQHAGRKEEKKGTDQQWRTKKKKREGTGFNVCKNVWKLEVFCEVSLEWTQYFGYWLKHTRFCEGLLIPNIFGCTDDCLRSFFWFGQQNGLEWSRHWGRATKRQILSGGLRFYWIGYSETGVWRLDNQVYTQNFDDIVCAGKFVDLGEPAPSRGYGPSGPPIEQPSRMRKKCC